MSNLSDLTIDPIEFDFLPELPNLIDLPESALQDAEKYRQSISNPQSGWQSYLALLALAGFSAWLTDYLDNSGLSLSFNTDRAKLLPNSLDRPAAITQLNLNQFRLCIIPASGNLDDFISIPQAAIDRPAHAAHFYVTVMVNSESGVAAVQSFLRYDQIRSYYQQNHQTAIDGYYEIPDALFEANLDKLLFLATGLDLAAIPLPSHIPSFSLDRVRELVIHPTLNAAHWIQCQVNQQRENLINTLTDTLNPLLNYSDDRLLELVPVFRGVRNANIGTPQTQINDIIQQMKEQGYSIPIDVRASYQNLEFNGQMIRLTIASWFIPSTITEVDEPEWSLIVIGERFTQSNDPIQVKVQCDEREIASIQLKRTEQHYVMQVLATTDETFIVSILDRQTEQVLPPIVFQPD